MVLVKVDHNSLKERINHDEVMRRYSNMHKLKFYRCSKCGKIITMLLERDNPTMCCGEKMQQLVPNPTDGAREKHLPVVTRKGSQLTVTVGSTAHPMTEAHYIEWIALETPNGFQIAYLSPKDKQSADFLCKEKVTAVYAYCNQHGLWKMEA